MNRNTRYPAAPAADLDDAEAFRPGAPMIDIPAREPLSVTRPAEFDFQPAANAYLLAVRPGLPCSLAFGTAQGLLGAVRDRLQDFDGNIPPGDAFLLSFAVDAALALYHASGASE